jgi:hypothetical protein
MVAALSAAIAAFSAITITLLLLNQVPQQVANDDATPSPDPSFILSPSPSPSPTPTPKPTRRPPPAPDLVILRFLIQQEMQNHLSGLTSIYEFSDPSATDLRISQAGNFFIVEYYFSKTQNNYRNTGTVRIATIVQCKYRITTDEIGSVLQFANSEIEEDYLNPDYREDGFQKELLQNIEQGSQVSASGVNACPDYFR